MKTLVACVVALGGMADAAWAQGQPQQAPPIGVGGVAAPTVKCAGGCPNHVACCTHNRTSMTVVDDITSSGAAWKQLLMGGQRVTLSSALAAGVDVEELVRTVDVTYGPCLACACPMRPHGCGGSQYMAQARWRIRYTRDQIAAVFKDAAGRDWAAVESAAWSAGTVLEFRWAMAGCLCDVGPQTQGPNDRPLVRGGKGSPPGSGQEDPKERPGIGGTSAGGGEKWNVIFGVGAGGGTGEDIDSGASIAAVLGGRYNFPNGFFASIEYRYTEAEFDFEELRQDRFQPIQVLVEEEEDLRIHGLFAGGGYRHALSPEFEIYGQLGVGRWFIGGADGVNGHVAGTVGGGALWKFSETLAASFDASMAFGSAEFHAGDGEGTLRSTWSALLGLHVRW